MPGDMPMPPDRYRDLVRARRDQPRPDPLLAVERRDLPRQTSPLAAAILAEATSRPLESGELLLLSEEATLADLEKTASAVATAPAPIAVPDDPLLAALTLPRLAARIDEIFGWQPPLAEHMKLLEAALQGGHEVLQIMLVGHVEILPERIEHLMRLRDLTRALRGRIVLTVRLADEGDLPDADPRVATVAASARPADPDLEWRHAQALARLVLGDGAVTAAPA